MPRHSKTEPSRRTARALVISLRELAKDKRGKHADRLRACELLAVFEGLIEAKPMPMRPAKNRIESADGTPGIKSNANELLGLIEAYQATHVTSDALLAGEANAAGEHAAGERQTAS